MKPIISIIAAAIRTELWLGFCQSLKNNKTPFEIIFIGPKKPSLFIKWRLPKNFKFIQSSVKVPQCIEAAARMAEGEYLVPSVDDARYNLGALDKIYAKVIEAKNDYAVGSVSWYKRGVIKAVSRHFGDLTDAPLMPIEPMIKTDVWREMGGLDIYFFASHAVTDLVLRIYEKGGFTVYADAKIKEIVQTGKMLWTTYGQKYDYPLLKELWIKNGKFCQRTKKFQPYENEKLLEKSQGIIIS